MDNGLPPDPDPNLTITTRSTVFVFPFFFFLLRFTLDMLLQCNLTAIVSSASSEYPRSIIPLFHHPLCLGFPLPSSHLTSPRFYSVLLLPFNHLILSALALVMCSYCCDKTDFLVGFLRFFLLLLPSQSFKHL